MRFSAYSSIRLLAISVLAFSAVAVAVDRVATNPLETFTLDHRQPWAVTQHVIDPFHGRNLILQTGIDRRIEPGFNAGESVDLLSVSPFADSTGLREMVGRKRIVSGHGKESVTLEISLARYRYPDGERIESRETDWMPNSQPAWDVRFEQGLRTVFSTGAGFLVKLDWTDARGMPVPDRGSKIEWGIEPPLGDFTNIGEPVWVTDPRFPDRLIVSFWGKHAETRNHYVGLAWIELNRDRTRIVDCGMLLQRNLGKNQHAISIRCPGVRLDDHGSCHVFWMERFDGERPWKLFTAKVRNPESETLANRAWSLGPERELASNCMPVPAYLAPDLSHAYFVVPKSQSCYDGGDWRKTRIDTAGIVLAPDHLPDSAIVFESAYRD